MEKDEKESRNNSQKRRDEDDDDKDRKKRSCDDSSEEERKPRSKQKKKRSREGRKSRKSKKRKKDYSSSSGSSSDSSDESSSDKGKIARPKKVVNDRLLVKLQARGETLEERNARRAEKRAALISQKFGYTVDNNPFNDPNLHEKFTWRKKETQNGSEQVPKKKDETFLEIEKVRQRRTERDLQREEMERIRAEESRMRELENYDEWAKKEEEFHLQQQRQRSAIRLVEGREKPVDVLAKNLLLFGLSDEDKKNRASIKYQEKYNAMEAMKNLEVELEEPYALLKLMKLDELEELRLDIEAFRQLERQARVSDFDVSASDFVLRYWDALAIVVDDEIKLLKSGGENGSHAKMAGDVQNIFLGQSNADLKKMKTEVENRLSSSKKADFDRKYWLSVAEQLDVFLCKSFLSEEHSKMLVRQLERLEKRREELARIRDTGASREDEQAEEREVTMADNSLDPIQFSQGDLEEELGLSDEFDLAGKSYSWQDKYRPRKPRYFNRVKTGYDWNKYNQTHYDKDNPPPKIVQGYKFNIFYTDLIDPTKTPTYTLEPADSKEFCIIRFRAGAPYEDIAFKIINREWNKSRKRGFKSSFERGVLSLYFNFTTHWYRR
ncbi:hypothetical protein FisN_1Lu323 [Fistulifera solaris]|uniref:Splicing factor Cactin n=1 Tax=Fistulifera solaris TaxID=1519565 RepID=A0A1Z5K466_FISSO|nr:hypothetical protein FisN_1Lu323 [Fistulifera solaris]|eukprot:GAX21009.1 hypothetical protein FisN_1Lu323 [Fistulifera solaris]